MYNASVHTQQAVAGKLPTPTKRLPALHLLSTTVFVTELRKSVNSFACVIYQTMPLCH